MKFLSVWDFVLSPVYIFIIYQIAKSREKKKIENEPYYKYFTKGLIAKIIGSISLCLIYSFYYNGGDTTLYFQSAVSVGKLISVDAAAFFRIIFGAHPYNEWYSFNVTTGWPAYGGDMQSFQVVRWTSLFTFFGLRCYILTSILLASIAYFGIWRLYKVFMYYYPEMSKELAIAILFIPSALFWGSGVLKDTYTLSAACLITYSFHRLFILKKERFVAIIILITSSVLVLSIKPYIFIALVPGALMWVSFSRIKNIQSTFIKIIVGPVILGIMLSVSLFGFTKISGGLGHYSSLDNALQKAVVTQQDLKQEYYQGNTFDIGEFDASVSGVLSKFPVAVFAGLYRPAIIEVKNVVMLLAALENLFMLYILINTIYKGGLFKFYRIVTGEPIVFFSLIFSVFFAFTVGLTTANFGALVRYKIPAVPFYIAAMMIVKHKEETPTESKLKLINKRRKIN